MDDEHLVGDAPDAHVIADGQKAESCGHEAKHTESKVPKFSETLRAAPCPPEAWPPSMPNIRSARPETGSLAD